MATKFQNLFWFYRGKADQEFNGAESMSSTIFYFILAFSTIVGFAVISSYIFYIVRLVTSLFVFPGKSLRSFGTPSKTWAVITGASDGIGREFALQLARAGYSTVLVSRTPSKLSTVADEIKQKYNTPTKTYAIDFASASDADYEALTTLLEPLDVGILINNVGLSHSIPVPFVQTPVEEMQDIIKINCLATLRVTQPIARAMIPRKRGLILTMGSFGGTYPTPLLATYSGSKSFLQHWSTALGAELAPHGITVELVQSYLVTSSMSKIRRPTMLIPSPRSFVRSVLTHLGRTGGAQGWPYTSTPFWSHAIMQWAVRNVLGGEGNGVLLWYNKIIHEGIRKRALKKKERDALRAGNTNGASGKKRD